MNISHTFIDLDDTIYPSSSGVWQMIKQRVYLYMESRFGIPREQGVEVSKNFVNKYGTTYKGLCEFYKVDEDDYFDFVHDIPLESALSYDAQLDHALRVIPGEKYILTNATSPHARRVLTAMKVEHHFQRIIDIKDMKPYCKPAAEAFEIAIKIAGAPSAHSCVFIDDLENNTRGALKLGFHAILFGKKEKTEGCSAAYENWQQIEKHLLNGSSI